MNAVLTPTRMTAQEYLAWEAVQPDKNEYIDGGIVAMTGVRLNHNAITLNFVIALRAALRGLPCGVFAVDVKLRVEAANAYFYPDVVVSCAASDLADGSAVAVHRPRLVAEVLSDSTRGYDLTDKFACCRRLESLTHYIVVESKRAHVGAFVKNAEGLWVLHPLDADDTLHFARPHPRVLPGRRAVRRRAFRPPYRFAFGALMPWPDSTPPPPPPLH